MLAGREPSQTIREDLRRLKQILEAGEVPVATAPRAAAPQTNAPRDVERGEQHELWRMP
jgi:hypothetical protein